MENEKMNNQQPQQQPTDKDKAFDLAFGGPKKDYSALDQKINAKGNYSGNGRSYGEAGIKDPIHASSDIEQNKGYENLAQKGYLGWTPSDRLYDRYEPFGKSEAKRGELREFNKAKELAGLHPKYNGYRDTPYSMGSPTVPYYLTVKLKDGRVVPYDLEEGETLNDALNNLRDLMGDEIEDVYDDVTNTGGFSIWR